MPNENRPRIDFTNLDRSDRCTITLALLDRRRRLQEDLRDADSCADLTPRSRELSTRWTRDELEMVEELITLADEATAADADGN